MPNRIFWVQTDRRLRLVADGRGDVEVICHAEDVSLRFGGGRRVGSNSSGSKTAPPFSAGPGARRRRRTTFADRRTSYRRYWHEASCIRSRVIRPHGDDSESSGLHPKHDPHLARLTA